MGYYSNFEYQIFNAKVNQEKIKEIEEFFKNYENEDVYGFADVKLITEGENLTDIQLEEYYAKFYDDRIFAEKLSEAVIDGEIHLYFTGEDGEKWGYSVKPNKVEELNFVIMTDEEYRRYKKFKSYLKVLAELEGKNDEEVLVKTENGSGPYFLKLKKGTKVYEAKYGLKLLFNDLAHDLKIHQSIDNFQF